MTSTRASMDSCHEGPTSVTLSRAGSVSEAGLPVSTLDFCVLKTLVELENFGVTVAEGDKICGGIVMTPMYMQHALYTEGKMDLDPEITKAKLVMAKLEGPEPSYVLVTEEQLADKAAAASLPKGLAIFAQVMSAAAISGFGWQRVPAVALLGSLDFPPVALAAAEALGLAVSPSMAGPHEEETATMLNVFLKSNKYPANRAFIMRDWGFALFAASIEDAVVLFDSTIRPCLAASSCPDAQTPTPTRMGALANAFRKLSSFTFTNRTQSEAEGGAMYGSAPVTPNTAATMVAASQNHSTGGAADGAGPGGLSRSAIGSPPSGVVIPDDIRKAPSMKDGSRRTSQEGRIPSFVTGMRPW